MEISSISASQLINMFTKAATALQEKQQELNSINVFPVADGDTGSNMVYTLNQVKVAIEHQENLNLKELSKIISETALFNSRGNSGTVLSQYFTGFCENITDQEITPDTFIMCLQQGAKSAKKAFLEPKKGTILDVMDAAAKLVKSKTQPSLIQIIENAVENAQKALEETKNTLPVLKKAGVVDAGGAGFLIILTGFLASIKDEEVILMTHLSNSEIGYIENSKLTFQYCTEVVFRRPNPDFDQISLQADLENLGDSIQIISNPQFVKAHIHSNEPEKVNNLLAKIGQVESFKVEDMQNMQATYLDSLHQNQVETGFDIDKDVLARYHTVIISDSSSDIPAYFLDRYPIKIVNLPVSLDSNSNVDIGHDLDLADFYYKMENDPEFIPKTSKVNTHTFYSAFTEALKNSDRVICLPLSKCISATYESALMAKEMLKNDSRIQVVDTQTASSGLAILLNYIFTSLEKDLTWDQIQIGIEKLKHDIQIYFVVDDIKYLERGGRISKTKAGIARLFNVQPLLKLSGGKIESDSDKIYFANETKKINSLFKKVKKYNQQTAISELFIVYAGQKALAESHKLVDKIESQLGIPKVAVNLIPLNPVVGSHSGPGSIGVIFV
jgi:uncharacterized protein